MTSSLPDEFLRVRRDLDNYFSESGRRAHVVWRLDGSYGGLRTVSKEIVNPPGGGSEGIWAEPIRLLDYVHLHLWDPEHGLAAVERHARAYERHVGYSEIHYRFPSHPDLDLTKRVWVPLSEPAVVVEVELANQADGRRDVRLFAEVQTSLTIGWPRRGGGPDFHVYDPALGAVVGHDAENQEWTAIVGADREPVGHYLGNFEPAHLAGGDLAVAGSGTSAPSRGCSCLAYDVHLPPNGAARLSLVVAGSHRGEAEATLSYQDVLDRLPQLFEERIGHYRRVAEETTLIETPSYQLDKAFVWAKLGTEDFKHHDPDIGLGFFAGYPAYNFYFASDSLRAILRGANGIGDFDDLRDILRTIVKYQAAEAGRDTLPGEIWHEFSTTGDRTSPNFTTLWFVTYLLDFWRWTGDRRFLEEIYPHLRAAVEWGYLKDLDGNGLLENFPEGEMADSAFEDRNMEGSHFWVNRWWFEALEAGAALALAVGDSASAERWSRTAAIVGRKLNTAYWNEHRRSFEETWRPDGCFDSSRGGAVATSARMVDEGKVELGLEALARQEQELSQMDAAAFLQRKREESLFKTWREFMSFYVVDRGQRALTLYQHHRDAPGCRALSDIASIPFQWSTPGLFPEVIGLEDPATRFWRGCFHQAWSASGGLLWPVVEGLFGIRPEASAHLVEAAPHFPDGWNDLAIRHLRVGQHRLEIRYRRVAQVSSRALDSIEASVANDATVPLVARLGFPLPASALVRGCQVNGFAAPIDNPAVVVERSPVDAHAFVQLEVPAGGRATARLDFAPAGLEVDTAKFQARVHPAARGTARLPVVVRNFNYASFVGHLAVEPVGGWQPPQRVPVDVPAGGHQELSLTVGLPEDDFEGYLGIDLSLEGTPGLVVSRRTYLPVYHPVAASLDGRAIARLDRPYELRVEVLSLATEPLALDVRLEAPAGSTAEPTSCDLEVAPGGGALARFWLRPAQGGPLEVRASVRCRATGVERMLTHALRVLHPGQRLVVYSGFLSSPLRSCDTIEVANLPANYAVRRPHVFEQSLDLADLVLTSDQHDAVFRDEQIDALLEFVRRGGKLLFFCYWSSPWGRGFHDTFGNVAGTALAEALPLVFKKEIRSTAGIRLTESGQTVLGAIEWEACPPYDFNVADARREAIVHAMAPDGSPLIAERPVGRGHVLAIAIDCFGYGSDGSFVYWSGCEEMIRRGVEHLLGL